MSSKPLVSIIIPTYNRAHLIGETLDSIKNQTYTHWECLVVDDGSIDDTDLLLRAYMEKDTRFQYFKRPDQKVKGANACRNFGFEKSKGDFILFVDSDDLISKNCLTLRVKVFCEDKTIDLVVADTVTFNDERIKDVILNKDPKNETSKHYLLMFLSYELPWTSTLSVLWRRAVIANNPFDENLMRLQDLDFHISILMQNNFKIERMHLVDNYYRVEPNKIKNKAHVSLVLNNLLIFLNKHMPSVQSKLEYRLAFKKFLSYFLQFYVFTSYNEFITESNMLIQKIISSNLYNKKENILIKIQVFLIYTKLNKLKYVGMYRLNKYLTRAITN